MPNSGESKVFRSSTNRFTPSHRSPEKLLDDGVKPMGTKRTLWIPRAFKYAASSRPFIQGAPTTSNGVSVPRPTETFAPSIKATPGYKPAAVTLRKFGEGFTHA